MGLDLSSTMILIWQKITFFCHYKCKSIVLDFSRATVLNVVVSSIFPRYSKSIVISGSRFLQDHNFNLAKNNIFYDNDKSRPTYHYRFTVTRKNNVTLRIVVLEKSKPTYRYRFTCIMIKKCYFSPDNNYGP